MHWYELNIKQLNSSNVLVQLGEYVKAQVGKHISQYVFGLLWFQGSFVSELKVNNNV